MRPNKAETAVQCCVCHMLVFAEFSSHVNFIYIYIYLSTGLLANNLTLIAFDRLYIYIYIYITQIFILIIFSGNSPKSSFLI